MRLSDSIEQFIKDLITQDEKEAEFKRNELAQYFKCAPSQINYVLATRFTPAHGYIIESHRGGGGCIRIFRMRPSTGDEVEQLFSRQIGDSIGELSALRLLSQLTERSILRANEASLMQAAVSARTLNLPLPEEMKDILRARILKQMLLQAIKNHTDHA